jgi:hypothetical protein
MSDSQIDRRVRSLVAELCANYFASYGGHRDYCCTENAPDHKCVYCTSEDARCGYFEKSVLPTNPTLQALYLADRRTVLEGGELSRYDKEKIVQAAEGPKVTCARCGNPYTPKSNRQKHCPVCRKAITKEQARERNRRLRQKAS